MSTQVYIHAIVCLPYRHMHVHKHPPTHIPSCLYSQKHGDDDRDASDKYLPVRADDSNPEIFRVIFVFVAVRKY